MGGIYHLVYVMGLPGTCYLGVKHTGHPLKSVGVFLGHDSPDPLETAGLAWDESRVS